LTAKTPTDFDDQLALLKTAFLDGLPGRIAEIADLAAVIAKDIPTGASRDDIVLLRALVHKLAGAGGTFGHLAVGDAAAWAERGCEDVLGRPTGPTAEQWRQVEARVEKLCRAAADAVATARRKSA
jgi:hypothetical protein